MSQENVEIATQAIDAWNRLDLDAFMKVWHVEAEWRPAFPKGTEGTGSVFTTDRFQPATLPRVKVLSADADPGEQYVRFSSKLALPERFSATVELDDPSLPLCHLEVAVERGRTVCEAIRLERRPGGHPVNGTVLREIPIGECVGRAASKLAALTVRSSTGRVSFTDPETGEEIPVYTKQMDDEHVALPVVGLDRRLREEGISSRRVDLAELEDARRLPGGHRHQAGPQGRTYQARREEAQRVEINCCAADCRGARGRLAGACIARNRGRAIKDLGNQPRVPPGVRLDGVTDHLHDL